MASISVRQRAQHILQRSLRSFSGATTSGTWGKPENEYAFETKAVHGGVKPDEKTGAVLTPLYLSTTFAQESVAKYLERGYSYTRSNNPTITAIEAKAALIENGYGASFFGTGMAATNTIMNTFLKTGDHCVITDCSYGGTNRLARELFTQSFGIEFSFVDFRDPEIVRQAIKPNTKLIFSESPANPTCTLTDIEAVSKIAKEFNCVHVCDATFATPLICRPLDFGADLTMQSTTKFYDGHNITVGGAVIAKTKELHEMIQHMRNVNGNIMAPQVAFQQLQTMKTMKLRVTQQSKTAMAVATFLESHPAVETVRYPGLASFPQKALADKQHANGMHGGMLWFEVKGGVQNGIRLMDSVRRPWTLAENLGAAESIITCPAVMTHANMLKEDRLKVGITDGFVRISCGIEDTDELIGALKESLDDLVTNGLV